MSKTCGKCGGRMEEGFQLDLTRNSDAVSHWVEGAPLKRWFGLNIRGKRRLPIEAWRCTRCGLLESYAPA